MIFKPITTTLVVVLLAQLNSLVTAWMTTTNPAASAAASTTSGSRLSTTTRTTTTQLFYLNDDGSDHSDYSEFLSQHHHQHPQQQHVTRRRASVEGVSIAPQGFWVMLRVATNGYIPLHVTADPADAMAATSPEALTMIQLLSGVDMAGAILPPDVLARLIVLQCERLVSLQHDQEERDETAASQNRNDLNVAHTVLADVQKSLPNATVSYSQVHEWFQSRVKLPEASLDEVVVTRNSTSSIGNQDFSLSCQIRNVGSLTFAPTLHMLKSVLYQFSPSTSAAFLSLALALRYQAPVTVIMHDNTMNGRHLENVDEKQETPTVAQTDSNTQDDTDDIVFSLESLTKQFPMFATRETLQQKSNRVQENIVKSFEIHKLTGALKIAMKLGDVAAAAKIRQALDEYDSMEDLPTTKQNVEEEDSNYFDDGIDSMQ